MKRQLINFVLWVVIVLLLLAIFTFFQSSGPRPSSPSSQHISFSQFLDLVDRGDVRAVDIDWPDIEVSTTRGETFRTMGPNDPTLVQRLHAKGVVVTARSTQPSQPQDMLGWLQPLVMSWLPFIFLAGTWLFLARRMRRGQAAPLEPFGMRPAPSAAALDDPAHWRGCAGEARTTADQLADLQSKRQMLEIARSYEYLARRAEERRRGPDTPA